MCFRTPKCGDTEVGSVPTRGEPLKRKVCHNDDPRIFQYLDCLKLCVERLESQVAHMSVNLTNLETAVKLETTAVNAAIATGTDPSSQARVDALTAQETANTNALNDAFGAGSPVDAPKISSFGPSNLAVGATLTIMGTKFTGARSVTFTSGQKAKYTVDSDTQITATVPAGAVSGTVTVENGSGQTVSSTSVVIL